MATRPTRTPGNVDSFSDVLLDIVRTHGWKQNMLAARFQISTKTVGRYIHTGAMPPIGRRHGIVHALADVDPALLSRLVATLGLTGDFSHGPPRPPVDADVARSTVEALLAQLMDKLDTGPVKTRAALASLLGQLAAANIDAATAQRCLSRT